MAHPSALDVLDIAESLDFSRSDRLDSREAHCFDCETDIPPDDWGEHECGIDDRWG